MGQTTERKKTRLNWNSMPITTFAFHNDTVDITGWVLFVFVLYLVFWVVIYLESEITVLRKSQFNSA